MCSALCPQLSCKWYSHVLWLLGQQDDLDLMPGEQSSLLVGSDGTPPTNQWVGHIVSCMVNRLRDVMVADGLSVEEEEDTSMHCADLPPWHAVARRATHLVEQWVGLGASLSSTSMVLLRLCRRIPFLFACLSGLTRCACMFPNYSEPLYQLAQFCQRQGLDQVSAPPLITRASPHPWPPTCIQECSQLLAGPLPEAFLQGKDRPTPPLQMKGNIFGVSWMGLWISSWHGWLTPVLTVCRTCGNCQSETCRCKQPTLPRPHCPTPLTAPPTLPHPHCPPHSLPRPHYSTSLTAPLTLPHPHCPPHSLSHLTHCPTHTTPPTLSTPLTVPLTLSHSLPHPHCPPHSLPHPVRGPFSPMLPSSWTCWWKCCHLRQT